MTSHVAARSIRRHVPAILLAAIVAMAVAYLASALATPLYTASATIQLSDTDAFSDVVVDPERRVRQEANRLTSRAVFEGTVEQLDANVSVNDLRSQVAVTADPAVGLLVVSATASDPDVAAEMANAVVSSYELVSRDATAQQLDAKQQSLQMQSADLRSEIADLQEPTAGATEVDDATAQRLEALRGQLEALEARDGEMTADVAAFDTGVVAVEQATPPSEPSSPQPLRNAAVAGAVGLMIALAVEYWRASIRESGLDPGAVLDAPLLAEIPDFGRSVSGGGESLFDVEAAEAYQFLLASFEHAVAKIDARSILVTSATPGEGKSLTAIHLARALAIQGRDVMLVDADIRARGLTAMLGAHDHPGFVALAEGEDLGAVVRSYRIFDTVRLPVVPAGQPPTQPTGLLATTPYREAIRRITEAAQLTIIDGGPLLTVADPLTLASEVSGVLLVVDADTPEDQLARVRQRLRLIPTPLIGYILNRTRTVGSGPYPYPLDRSA